MNISEKEFIVRYEESQNISIEWTILKTILLKITQILLVPISLIGSICIALGYLIPIILFGISVAALFFKEIQAFLFCFILSIIFTLWTKTYEINEAFSLFILSLKQLKKFDTFQNFIIQDRKRNALLNDFGMNEEEAEHQYHIARHIFYFAMIQKICALNENAMYSQKELLKGLFGFDKSTIQEYIYESEYTEDDLKFYGEHAKAMDLKERKSFAGLLFKLAIVQDGIHNDEWELLMQIMVDLKLNNNYINHFIKRYGPLRTEYEDERKDSTSTGERTVAYLNPYYAILGLDNYATKKEIKKAYHALALEHHPDLPKNAGRIQECEKMMAKINEAYDKIKD